MPEQNSYNLKQQKDAILELCLEDEAAFCTAVCPFRLDVRKFIERISFGNFTAACRIYREAVGFPAIAAALCDEPCEKVCASDAAVAMNLLEKTCIALAGSMAPQVYNIPQKKERVAVIGGGISGLGCALKLVKKKYIVTIYEKSGRIGGRLWQILPPDRFLNEIETQFAGETWQTVLNNEIRDFRELSADAVFICTGREGADFGLRRKTAQGLFCTEEKGVFLGGELLGCSPAEALAQGLRAANYIESYLKTGNNCYSDEKADCKLHRNAVAQLPTPVTEPAAGDIYTKEEAAAEAARCLRCKCEGCLCSFMQYYKKMPVKISADAGATAGADGLKGEIKVATKLISSCNLCGQCAEGCPQGIDMEAFLLQARIAMHNKNAIPWAYNDFFLRDMEHAASEMCCIRIVPQKEPVTHLFFPGCQLGASDPRYVLEAYRYLLRRFPGTALTTNCCGAPGLWAGDRELQEEALAEIRGFWKNTGRPLMLLGCPTCGKMFAQYAPELRTRFLYEFLDVSEMRGADRKLSVFDPCSARYEEGLREAVRRIAGKAGMLEPLPREGEKAQCCGYGGHTAVAAPEYTKEVIQNRIGQSENDYVTYCSNCRDVFAAEGKRAYHILDLFFGINEGGRRPPTVTRRRNREELKRRLAAEFQGGEVPEPEEQVRLKMEEKVREKLNREMILEDCICEVIADCEASGRKVQDPQNGHNFGYKQVGNMTYWVEYTIDRKVPLLINAYCHRMAIQPGGK